MDIVDLIDRGLVEPSRFSGEAVVSRQKFEKFCKEYKITDKRLARCYYAAMLNYAKKADYCDGNMQHVERLMAELLLSQKETEVVDVVEVFVGSGESLDYRNAGFVGMKRD